MSYDIHIASLHRPAYVAIQDLAARCEWPEVYAWMDPGEYLLLIERLKRTEDSHDVFPMGKWVTILRMQEIFEKGFSE